MLLNFYVISPVNLSPMNFFLAYSFLFFFPFIFISWRLITLQYCSGFCHTLSYEFLKIILLIYFGGAGSSLLHGLLVAAATFKKMPCKSKDLWFILTKYTIIVHSLLD